MNIIIAGGGRVGCHLARILGADRQNITIIESNAEHMEQVNHSLDVNTVFGDGSSALKLQSMGVGAADLFVASMGNNEMNLIAAASAKGLGAKQVVARVDNPMYIDSNILYESILGIDYILSPDALAALEIANYIENPGILASEEFGRGLIRMKQVRVSKTLPVEGYSLREIMPPKTGVLVGIVNHKGESIIPRGDTLIRTGDVVTLIGHRDGLSGVQRLFREDRPKIQRVAIMGGSTIGFRLAAALETQVSAVKIFERRKDRCTMLSERLKRAKVICRDATSRIALEQEHINQFDVFVAATRDDERNIMASVLAKEVGAKMVATIVYQPDFAPLVERLGIDLAITPHASISSRILRLAYQGRLTSLSIIGEGRIEVVEIEIGPKSSVLGRKISEYSAKFPRNALIAAILRGQQVIVPSGEDDLREEDSVVVIAFTEAVETARRMLQG